jgi:hypothetical protein
MYLPLGPYSLEGKNNSRIPVKCKYAVAQRCSTAPLGTQHLTLQ